MIIQIWFAVHVATYFKDHDEASEQQLQGQALDYDEQQAIEDHDQQQVEKPQPCYMTWPRCDGTCHSWGACWCLTNECFC